jgi:menaquinone-specific isochorismate synthase
MIIVDSNLFPCRDRDSLCQFFEHCRNISIEKKHPQLVSVSLEVKHIDPLGVLKSIHEDNTPLFYMEHPSNDEAIAGIESVLQFTHSSKDRFEKAREFCEQTLEHTIAIGDLNLPFTGPHFFNAFTFHDEIKSNEDNPFTPLTVFVPRIQFSHSQGTYSAVANTLVTADMTRAQLETIADRIWRTHQKFNHFDYTTGIDKDMFNGSNSLGLCSEAEVGFQNRFETIVTEAVERIIQKRYEKIVLARALDLECPPGLAFSPFHSLHALRSRFPNCYTFAFSNGEGRLFIGSTPEKILSIRNGELKTEALAGSAPRGADAREDALLAQNLYDSDKDRHEQRLVYEAIVEDLKTFDITPTGNAKPRLLKLPYIQHLLTPVQAPAPENVHFYRILEKLHPTPAVGGFPRSASLPDIRELEYIERSLYAGTLGWFNYCGEGEMVVGIRSALLEKSKARLFAGSGIVQTSVPFKEKSETDVKFKAMRELLQVIPTNVES